MKNNKKGAALMQVLLITMVLAGITTALLRVTLSRTSSARQLRRVALAESLIQSCMAEVNSLWSKKTIEAFSRDLQGKGNANVPYMYCSAGATDSGCTTPQPTYTCNINGYQVIASFEVDPNDSTVYRLKYQIPGTSAKKL